MKYKKGDLFTAPSGSYLLHACNCYGQWGSGIAKEFKERFPASFKRYSEHCLWTGAMPGDILFCKEENGYQVVCVFTSKGYGKMVDSPEMIVEATKRAFVFLPKDKPIHMPKINSGLFNVPWEKTAELLDQYKNLDITVWTNDWTKLS